jgi:peptidoglycan/LPS O-acetylase OafA/YrhL
LGLSQNFYCGFFIVSKSTKRLEAVNTVRKFVILDYLRMLAVVVVVVVVVLVVEVEALWGLE